TVVGIIIADHLPGVKTHRLNTPVLCLSRIAEPADLIIITRLTRPVFKSISSRYKPSPEGLATNLPGRSSAPARGIAGRMPESRHVHWNCDCAEQQHAHCKDCGSPHSACVYHFVIAVWSAKEAQL